MASILCWLFGHRWVDIRTELRDTEAGRLKRSWHRERHTCARCGKPNPEKSIVPQEPR